MKDLQKLISNFESIPKVSGDFSSLITSLDDMNNELEEIIKQRIKDGIRLEIDTFSSSSRRLTVDVMYNNKSMCSYEFTR